MDKHFFILGNNLYSSDRIRDIHPGGKALLRAINNRCVERYLYGIESLEGIPSILHSHSTISLSLLGPPVG
jgi:hypothetical protein